MSNIIFYFTGTGNSLAVARDIAEKIGDTKVVSIAEAMREEHVDLSYERIGIVFPVYFSSIPAIVRRFIAKLSFNKSQYVFGVVTFGGTHGLAFSQLSQLVAERGGFLKANFGMPMPGNYIVKYGAFPMAMQQRLLKKGKEKADSISITVKEKGSTRLLKADLVSRLLIGYVNKMVAGVGGMAGNFRTTEKCNGCGTCERVCPVGNINMVDKKPKWGNACEQCVACIQWCPMQAIEYADRTTKRKRYHNPDVKLSDFFQV